MRSKRIDLFVCHLNWQIGSDDRESEFEGFNEFDYGPDADYLTSIYDYESFGPRFMSRTAGQPDQTPPWQTPPPAPPTQPGPGGGGSGSPDNPRPRDREPLPAGEMNKSGQGIVAGSGGGAGPTPQVQKSGGVVGNAQADPRSAEYAAYVLGNMGGGGENPYRFNSASGNPGVREFQSNGRTYRYGPHQQAHSDGSGYNQGMPLWDPADWERENQRQVIDENAGMGVAGGDMGYALDPSDRRLLGGSSAGTDPFASAGATQPGAAPAPGGPQHGDPRVVNPRGQTAGKTGGLQAVAKGGVGQAGAAAGIPGWDLPGTTPPGVPQPGQPPRMPPNPVPPRGTPPRSTNPGQPGPLPPRQPTPDDSSNPLPPRTQPPWDPSVPDNVYGPPPGYENVTRWGQGGASGNRQLASGTIWNESIDTLADPNIDQETRNAITQEGMLAARSAYSGARGALARRSAATGNSAGGAAAIANLARGEAGTYGQQARQNQIGFEQEAQRRREGALGRIAGLYTGETAYNANILNQRGQAANRVRRTRQGTKTKQEEGIVTI